MLELICHIPLTELSAGLIEKDSEKIDAEMWR